MSNLVIDVHNLLEFQELLSKHQFVIVKFSAEWCSPCKRIHPFYVKQCSENSHICFVHIDVDEVRDVCEHCDVSAMPTFILYENGEEKYKFSGANTSELMNTIEMCKN